MINEQHELETFASGMGITVYKLIHNRDVYVGVLSAFTFILLLLMMVSTVYLFNRINELERTVYEMKIANNKNIIHKEIKYITKPNSLRPHTVVKKENIVVLNLDEFEVTKVKDGENRKTVWARKKGPKFAQWYTYSIVK